MEYLKKINLGFKRNIPVILQTESSECGLACLAMISSYYGFKTDLFTLRKNFSINQKGINLKNLADIANKLEFNSRPIKVEISEFNHLRLPCVLHWNFNHFVVLSHIVNNKFVILDPAFGKKTLNYSEISEHFTGIALELWPNSKFEKKVDNQKINIRQLMGRVIGLWPSLIKIFLLLCVLEVFALINPMFMQIVIDQVLLSSDLNLLHVLAIGFAIILLLQQLISLIQSWVIMHLSTTISVQWKSNVFKHLISLPTEYFAKRHLGDIVSRFGSVDFIQKTLTTTFITAILDGLMTVFTCFFMLLYSVKLTLIIIVSVLIYIIIRFSLYYPLWGATEEQIVYAAKQSTYFMETLRGIKTLKLFNKAESRSTNWINLFVDQINSSLRTQKMMLVFSFSNGILFGIVNVIVIWLGAQLVLEESFTVGFFIAFIAYKNQFISRIVLLIDKYFELRMLSLHGYRLADILLHKTEENKQNTYEDIEIFNGDLKVENLRYRYSNDEPFIIDTISFEIKAGESVVFVGPTGCGKTTLMNLILGILTPTVGKIYIDGININHINKSVYNKIIGTVTQDDVLFAGSIIENITFFDENPDLSWAKECAHLASIRAEIENMPMSYQTLIGDMGNILSGGQKQRLLLARALYKRPKILFLDEATSSLDILKEREINKTIQELKITRIIIAHRPETIMSADRVISLNHGKIIVDKEISVAQ